MKLFMLWFLGWSPNAHGSTEPLQLEDVLLAVHHHAPKLSAYRAKVAEAEGKLLSASGAFDPKLKAKATDYLTGPYPRLMADTSLGVVTPFGPEFSVGYRIGTGTFPDYYGAYETLDLGEVRLEVATPLLADLGMTAERAKRLLAEQDADAARLAQASAEQEIYTQAAQAYWKWVAAGEKLAISSEMLRIAEERQQGLTRQVAAGAMAELEAIDNARVVASRTAERFAAEQALTEAAIKLSLYYRDERLQTIVPTVDQWPGPIPAPAPAAGDEDALIARAIAQRPDLRLVDTLLTAVDIERQRARSAVLPNLDGNLIVSQDQGDPSAKLAKPELAVGVALEVPLALRKGRGELARTDAARERLSAERRYVADTVRADVQTVVRTRTQAETRWTLSATAVQHAARVAELERRAFDLGSSDIFKVTKREETLAKEQKAEVEARMDVAMLDASIRAVTATWDLPNTTK